ncbi:MAG: FAD:protein FMN transferase [Bacillota bacterium]|nr:FAD:protein FMN transferase [Bacillota bacterium]
MKLFKKTDLIVIALLCVAAAAFLFFNQKHGNRLFAEIYHHNHLIHRIPLHAGQNAPHVIEIENVKIQISEDGAVAFTHSDCPDQICVHSGKIDHDGQQIACVPNHILVKIVGESAEKFSTSFTGSFNTVSNLVGEGMTETEFKECAAYLNQELHALHLLYSIYDDIEPSASVNLAAINKQGIGEYRILPELAEMLLYGKDVFEVTGSRVDITMGELLELWHHARHEQVLPDPKALASAIKKIQIGKQSTRLDEKFDVATEEGDTYLLHIKSDDFSFDVGAIAKGFALDLLAERLSAQYPNASLLLSLGGNIKSTGSKGDWVIGIQHPDKNSVFASFILPHGMAVATSGIIISSTKRRDILQITGFAPSPWCRKTVRSPTCSQLRSF